MFPRLVHLDERLQSQQLNLPSALVIEGDEDFRFCVVEFLRRQGWIAHGVRRGEQALPILAHLPCHLIVVGSDLPGMPGIDFARILHTSRRWRASPFVIIARLFNQAFATELAEFGAFLVRKSAWEDELSGILVGLRGDAAMRPRSSSSPTRSSALPNGEASRSMV